jgi:hypothetical protein
MPPFRRFIRHKSIQRKVSHVNPTENREADSRPDYYGRNQYAQPYQPSGGAQYAGESYDRFFDSKATR